MCKRRTKISKTPDAPNDPPESKPPRRRFLRTVARGCPPCIQRGAQFLVRDAKSNRQISPNASTSARKDRIESCICRWRMGRKGIFDGVQPGLGGYPDARDLFSFSCQFAARFVEGEYIVVTHLSYLIHLSHDRVYCAHETAAGERQDRAYMVVRRKDANRSFPSFHLLNFKIVVSICFFVLSASLMMFVYTAGIISRVLSRPWTRAVVPKIARRVFRVAHL